MIFTEMLKEMWNLFSNFLIQPFYASLLCCISASIPSFQELDQASEILTDEMSVENNDRIATGS